ncbi:hypothetical protein FB451DRAFT_1029037, partial [Mycena latifolia]
TIDAIISKVAEVVDADLQFDIDHLQKTHLLRNRLESVEDKLALITRRHRHYLTLVTIPAHRKALTRLLLNDHTLSVERLRSPASHRRAIPCDDRLCRFCRGAVEDEVHVLFDCVGHPVLTEMREEFLSDTFVIDSVLEVAYLLLTHYKFLRRLVSSRKVVTSCCGPREYNIPPPHPPRLAKYVCEVLAFFNRFQCYILVVYHIH